MSDLLNKLNESIEGVVKKVEDMRKANDQALDEERKGNKARAQELLTTVEKLNEAISGDMKNREVLERKLAAQAERLEIIEAMNERPRASVQDKIRGEHKQNFLKWLRAGGNDAGAVAAQIELQAKAAEFKDVSTGTTTAGGFALPEEISRTVNMLVLKRSEISAAVKNVTVGTTDYKELLTHFANSTASNLYGWAGETSSRTATGTPELRERTPTWGELYAYATASNWSLQDLFFNVEQWITDAVAEGMSVAQSTAIWSGNGSSRPTGMTNTALSTSDDYASPLRSANAYEYIPIPTAGSSPFTTAGITADAVIALFYQLNPRYRPNSRFAANTVTQGHIRRLKDTTNQYLWQPGLQAGQPDTLLGRQIITWEDMGNPTTSAAYPLAFGDFAQAYVLVNREGMTVVRDNITAPGFTKFYLAKRVGGCVTNNDALKFLKCSLS